MASLESDYIIMNMTVDVLSKNEHGFVANAPSSVSVFSLARRVAEFNVPVLCNGQLKPDTDLGTLL